jgi:hypothetical protein
MLQLGSGVRAVFAAKRRTICRKVSDVPKLSLRW